ncbi:MAG TPA: phosphoesterase, partial [Candidatus Aenigmarchaeota archaeon]|nr:phosphoesterase [Candidatus Aenigmarchaeota archaeon]
MELMKGVEIVDKYGIFLKEFKALVIADLHIGYEAALEKQGIMIPKSQYPKIRESIEEMIKISKPETLIINGDVKHEFEEATRQEWKEVLDLLDFLQSQN